MANLFERIFGAKGEQPETLSKREERALRGDNPKKEVGKKGTTASKKDKRAADRKFRKQQRNLGHNE